MSWKFWKHKSTNAIISEADHGELTDAHKKDFAPAPEAKTTTHRLHEDYLGGKEDSDGGGSLLTTLLVAETLLSDTPGEQQDDLGGIGDGPSMGGDNNAGNDFGGFGGGDGGGAGAGDTF